METIPKIEFKRRIVTGPLDTWIEYDVLVNGEKKGIVMKAWSRLGGEGWQYHGELGRHGSTKRTLKEVKFHIIDLIKRRER